MSVEGSLLHRHLRGYKDDRDARVRDRMSGRLAALLAVFLRHHRGCVGEFDSVVDVPSARGAAVAPILQRVRALKDQYAPALVVTGVGDKSDLHPDRFALTRSVDGERLLVLDDTFTRGRSLFSAVAALRQEGAAIAGPIVLGRHVQPNWPTSEPMLSWLKQRQWDETRCCRCDGEMANPGQML